MLNWKERIISGIVVIGVGGMMLWTAGSRLTKNLASYADSLSADEYFTTEDDEWAKTWQFSRSTAYDDDSLMPCCDPEAFERWYATYEQETVEEVSCEDTERNPSDDSCDPEETETTVETALESESEGTEIVLPCYAVDGCVLNPELQAYLYQRLADHNIEWFMPYAVLIAYQESRFDCTAVNSHNGIDCGLFQFRLPYYTGQDIFNPYEQIDIFCEQMANRANAGCDVYEMISRHNVSDWGAYNHEYVSTVLSHEMGLKEVQQ